MIPDYYHDCYTLEQVWMVLEGTSITLYENVWKSKRKGDSAPLKGALVKTPVSCDLRPRELLPFSSYWSGCTDHYPNCCP